MISVCLATFNGSDFIYDQLKSILNQIGVDDEVIISDNYSQDNTLEIVRNIGDSRIKIFFERNLGVVSNFENALRHAKGDFIFLSDQDDVWLPSKVSVVLEHLTSCDLVLHDAVVVNSRLMPISSSLFELNKTSLGFVSNIITNSYVGCCMALKKKF